MIEETLCYFGMVLLAFSASRLLLLLLLLLQTILSTNSCSCSFVEVVTVSSLCYCPCQQTKSYLKCKYVVFFALLVSFIGYLVAVCQRCWLLNLEQVKAVLKKKEKTQDVLVARLLEDAFVCFFVQTVFRLFCFHSTALYISLVISKAPTTVTSYV